MQLCYICRYRVRLTPRVNQMASQCPQCGIVYTMDLEYSLEDLVRRGAPWGVLWHEIMNRYPQTEFRPEGVEIPDRARIDHDREMWCGSEYDRMVYHREYDRLAYQGRDIVPAQRYADLEARDRAIAQRLQAQQAEYARLLQQAQMAQYQATQQQQAAMAGQLANAAGGLLGQAMSGCTTTYAPVPLRPRTPEEQEADRIRQIAANAQLAAQRKDQGSANARARALLVEAIGEDAVVRLDMGGTYPIPSKRYPGTEYHLRLKRAPVRVVKQGRIVHEVCIQPTAAMPDYDMVLALKKLIEHDETVLIGTGNLIGEGDRPTQTTRDRTWWERMMGVYINGVE